MEKLRSRLSEHNSIESKVSKPSGNWAIKLRCQELHVHGEVLETYLSQVNATVQSSEITLKKIFIMFYGGNLSIWKVKPSCEGERNKKLRRVKFIKT